jgi:deoxyadenosine/deoxycytidine kinase
MSPRRLAHPDDIICALRAAARRMRHRMYRRRNRLYLRQDRRVNSEYYAAYNARYSTRAARAERKNDK